MWLEPGVRTAADVPPCLISALARGPPIDTIYDEKGSGVSHDAGLPATGCGGSKLPLSQFPFKEKAT
jgi:hypothetical protein